VSDQLHVPAALHPGKNSSTHCTGGWVDTRATLDGFKEQSSCPYQNSNPWPSSLLLVTTSTTLSSIYINYCNSYKIFSQLESCGSSHTTCTISDFSLFSSRLFRFASLRCRFSSLSFFLSSIKARECSLTRFSSNLSVSFFSFDLLIPGVLITDENLLQKKEHYNTITLVN
jgi:hypothetical protein